MEIVRNLYIKHAETEKDLKKQDYSGCKVVLEQCQELAIKLGNQIEESVGTGASAIALIEQYCEDVYQLHELLNNTNGENQENLKKNKKLYKQLIAIENNVRNEIPERIEAVFLPYKASMWDSLESVWMAAAADPNCDAYVIPIPYYDKNPDGSCRKNHYEGDLFPENVPITHYNDYDFAAHHPDMIFIHNPYDDGNYVTSVHPFFYSQHLKEFTDCLVYIPYFIATSGIPGDEFALLPVYTQADYLITQSKKAARCINDIIPRSKILPMGSPKLDKVIRLCQNPPQIIEEWKSKMVGKTVYFYNTSLTGMLIDTSAFLKKLRYVMETFRNHDAKACLLWRPHPLLESTFKSMRPSFYPEFEKLKHSFLKMDNVIFDETPEIEKSISWSDCYIGDPGTSVTALFGIVGKPLFILDNQIHKSPGNEDWRGNMIQGFVSEESDQWMITGNNALYFSEHNDYQYSFCCRLSNYIGGCHYLWTFKREEYTYICPASAQEILIVKNQKIVKRVLLQNCLEKSGAFAQAYCVGQYIFLIPIFYPAIVRYDMQRDHIEYIEGYNDVFVQKSSTGWGIGGNIVWKDQLYIASRIDNRVLVIQCKTGKTKILEITAEHYRGCYMMQADEEGIWLLPSRGLTVIYWNPESNDTKEYQNLPSEFRCYRNYNGEVCEEYPFRSMISMGEKLIFSPWWGNMFVCMDRKTGASTEWETPFSLNQICESGYYQTMGLGYFLKRKSGILFYNHVERRLYQVDINDKRFTEIPVCIKNEELLKGDTSFGTYFSELPYCCMENAFHSLNELIDHNDLLESYHKEESQKAFMQIAENTDGSSGRKIYDYLKDTVS